MLNASNGCILPRPLDLGHGVGSFLRFYCFRWILSLTYTFLDAVGKDQEARRLLGVRLLLPYSNHSARN